MKLTLKIWRQKNAESKGKLESFELDGLNEDMAFLELLDLLNEKLSVEGKPAIEFDHDCREGNLWSMFIGHQWKSPWTW